MHKAKSVYIPTLVVGCVTQTYMHQQISALWYNVSINLESIGVPYGT